MSEESKTAEGDYVMMGYGGGAPVTAKMPGLDDPNLSQEDRDHRIAIALQQQENAAAYDAEKKRHDDAINANKNRTTRSGTFSRLAAVRDKDHGMLSVPADYTTENAYVSSKDNYAAPGAHVPEGTTPQQIADYKLALELQKVDQAGAGTAREMSKLVNKKQEEEEAKHLRTTISKNTL
jgi:hypothetical protein